jgi:RNA 2',3'-cyclic 3'-phosphodiesterase
VRLFVAVNLPSLVRDQVWNAASGLRSTDYPIRWVGRDLIHLTLKFLGNVAPDRLDSVRESIQKAVVGAKTFPLVLEGAGAFPNARRPSVLWVGCERVPSLELVQDALERELDRVGFPIEGRPFRPHLTIGRVKRHSRPSALMGLEEMLESIDLHAEALVTSVDLMESHLGHGGPRYENLFAAPLEQGERVGL